MNDIENLVCDAINFKYPEAVSTFNDPQAFNFTATGRDADGLETFEISHWNVSAADGTPIKQPTKRAINTLIKAYRQHLLDTAYIAARIAAYPNPHDLMDAEVKIASGDPVLVAEGEQQKSTYVAACLAVKQNNPKPGTTGA